MVNGITNLPSTKKCITKFCRFWIIRVLHGSCSRCFFSNSNNLLFFSDTSDNPNTEDRQIRVPGWGGDGRRSEKKGEVTGIRGIVMGGSRPAVGGRIGKRRGASGGIRAAGMEEGVGTVLVVGHI